MADSPKIVLFNNFKCNNAGEALAYSLGLGQTRNNFGGPPHFTPIYASYTLFKKFLNV